MANLQNSLIGCQRVGRGSISNNGSLTLGCCALNYSPSAYQSIALGVNTLKTVSSGQQNTAVGYKALCSVTTGNGNTAVGYLAGCSVTTGGCNTFLGYKTYPASSAAACSRNTAIGVCTQRSLIGNNNTAIGFCAQTTSGTTTGNDNVAIGWKAGFQTEGSDNVTIGSCTSAYGKSTIVGGNRLHTTSTAVAVGYGNGYSGGESSIALGYKATAQGVYSIAVGLLVNVTNDYHIQWGNAGNNSKNCIWPEWSFFSDQRDKANTQSLNSKYGIEFIKKLKPKTFNWDNRENYVRECGFEFGQKDGSLTNSEERYGFIAQEIKETINQLGIKFDALGGEENDAYRLEYTAFIAPMIKTIQEISERLELLDEEVIKLETL